MSDRAYVVLVALLLTGLSTALVVGHGPLAGRELFQLTGTHGVNDGDLPVVGVWVLGMACCWRLWRARGD